MKRLVAILIFFSIKSAHAFTFIESAVEPVWSNLPLSIWYDPTNCHPDVESALQEAISLWNNVPTSRMKMVLESAKVSVSPSILYNQGSIVSPVVVCDPQFSSTASNVDPNVVAGFGFYSRMGTSMTYGGVIINADSTTQARYDRMNYQQWVMLLAHELGHVMGLGHSSSESCLMYYSLGQKTTARLSQDDEDAVTYLYPRDELGKDKPFGCGRVKLKGSDSGSPSESSGAWPVFAIILLLLPLGVLGFLLPNQKNYSS